MLNFIAGLLILSLLLHGVNYSEINELKKQLPISKEDKDTIRKALGEDS